MAFSPLFFDDPASLQAWFERHGTRETELVVGFRKVHTGRAGLRWAEAVDEALCVGWIDGIRHRLDDDTYQIRFTPRRPGSTWSAVNIRRVAELQAEGRMKPEGLAVFAAAPEARRRTASYEQADPRLAPVELRGFRRRAAAWAFYQALPAGYRKKVTWWVLSAKKPETRARRLALLVEACAQGRRL
ncbi:MAG: YdeI/OmpD-associated family protein [Acidobacteria bacterium]|nr:YdeI/OmpD-associated family protein [Acidobacteriota bacterium]